MMLPTRMRPFLALLLLVGCAQRPAEPDGPDHTWPKEVVELARTFPIQEGGRVKPLSTQAQFAMLRIHGKRTLRFKNPKRKQTPTEWFLDCLFYPEQARRHKIFRIEDNWEVLDDLGLPRDKEKRGLQYYSFDFLATADKQLREKAREYQHLKDRKVELTAVQEQVLVLFHNYQEFALLTRFLDFARARYPTKHEILQRLFPGHETVRFSQLLAKMPELRVELRRLFGGEDAEPSAEALELSKSYLSVERLGQVAHMVAYMPPARDEVFDEGLFQGTGRTWLSPALLTARVIDMGKQAPDKIALLEPWERLVELLEKPEAFAFEFRRFHDSIRELAEARGEWAKIPMEVSFYRADYFYWGLILFTLSFLLCACQWLSPRNRLLYRATWVATLVPFGLLVTGIVIRCILRSRPPVSNLYETFLFITAVAVLVALIIEWINRARVAQPVAALLGALGLFMAMGFEGLEKRDTMAPLIAVLDTNFWLSTHVTTINIGYAASLLAAGIGSVYFLGKLFGIRQGDPSFYKAVSRMTYGTICFGLVFSTVGTILGGIWANDSWGRFWGWDPKENGALLIVLAQIAILHARMGGYLREFGICLVTPFLGAVVLFSWFHVNLLEVGLHSYGHSSELKLAVMIAYGVMGLLLGLGILAWYLEQRHEVATTAATASDPDPARSAP